MISSIQSAHGARRRWPSTRSSAAGAALAGWLVLFGSCGYSGAPRESQRVESDGDDRASSGEPRAGARESEPAGRSTEAGTGRPDDVRILTGARARVVWVQDVGDGTDILSSGDRLRLMAYDTHDGLGERPILAERSNYAKPLITPLGNRVVFSDLQRGSAFIVSWDGSGLRRLAEGFALATWIDPDTRVEWVYMGTDEAPTDPPSYRSITRYRIDRLDVSEVVWDQRPVSGNSFQLSADGRLAGGLFPWPRAGVAELPNGSWHRLGRGCWTALSAGPSPLCWYFDGSHRKVTVVDVEREQRWQVDVNTAPGIDGHEVYHPRWTNHPRFLTVTGPYTVGNDANKIRGGGQQVEIHLGRFAPDFAAVESWARVTHNERADFYPDAWIEPSEEAPGRMTPDVRPEARPPSDVARREPAARLVVEARVLEDVPIPTPESILPYRRALLVNTYEVVRVLEGAYEESKILVAHWVIRDGQILDTAGRERGALHRMSLEPFDEHEELEGERLVMDTDEFALRLYYDAGS